MSDLNVAYWLVTRFNVYMSEFRDTVDDAAYENWCRKRVSLFNAITLPSVLAQTTERFRWIMVMDTETNSVLDDFTASLADVPRLGLLYVNLRGAKGGTMQATVAAHIAKRARAANTHVCTARLDSDDALHRDYMITLRRNAQTAAGDEAVRVIFPYVATWDGSEMRVGLYPRNHFSAMFEPLTGPIMTAYAGRHTAIRHNDVTLHPNAPMALTTVHDTNMWNALHEKDMKLADPMGALQLFGLDAETAAAAAAPAQVTAFSPRRPNPVASDLVSDARSRLETHKSAAAELAQSVDGTLRAPSHPDDIRERL